MCDHLTCAAEVAIIRDDDQRTAKIRIACRDCGASFRFVGLRSGSRSDEASRSADGLEARLPIAMEDDAEIRCPECGRILFGEHLEGSVKQVDCGPVHVVHFEHARVHVDPASGNVLEIIGG